MRIVAFGDTHTQHHALKLPEGDVLIFAGDGEFRNSLELFGFDDWLSGFKYKLIIAIAGNHDFYCESYPNEVKNYLTKVVYLKDEPHVLPNGMTIWGSPMTPTFLNWAFMESEDIAQPGGEHLGSKTLAKRIDSLKIPYVICGHIHGGYGVDKTKDTTYINCSVLNEDYQLVNKPVVIDV